MKSWLLVLAVAVAAPVAWAQPLEFEPIDPPAADKRAPARKQRSPQARSDAIQGQVYTYADGDRTVRVRLQSDLEVSEDRGVTRSGGEHIVPKDSARRSSGLPVFRSESSGTLMTLPGGVLLVLVAEWSGASSGHCMRMRSISCIGRPVSSRQSDFRQARYSSFTRGTLTEGRRHYA